MSASRGLSQAISSSLAGHLLLKDTRTHHAKVTPGITAGLNQRHKFCSLNTVCLLDPTPGYQKTNRNQRERINPMASSSSPPNQQPPQGRVLSEQYPPLSLGPCGSTTSPPSGAEATKAYLAPDRNSFMIDSRSFWGMSPCMDDTVKLASLIFSVSQSTYRSEQEMCSSTKQRPVKWQLSTADITETQRKLSPTNC